MTNARDVFTPYLSARSDTSPTIRSNRQDDVSWMLMSYPSRASNAADALIPLGPILRNADILSAYVVPHSSQAGSATNFAVVRVIDTGSAGTGTTVLASKTYSATGTSVAAAAMGAMAAGAAASVAGPTSLAVSYASQGNGIALVAHSVYVAYRNR